MKNLKKKKNKVIEKSQELTVNSYPFAAILAKIGEDSPLTSCGKLGTRFGDCKMKIIVGDGKVSELRERERVGFQNAFCFLHGSMCVLFCFLFFWIGSSLWVRSSGWYCFDGANYKNLMFRLVWLTHPWEKLTFNI